MLSWQPFIFVGQLLIFWMSADVGGLLGLWLLNYVDCWTLTLVTFFPHGLDLSRFFGGSFVSLTSWLLWAERGPYQFLFVKLWHSVYGTSREDRERVRERESSCGNVRRGRGFHFILTYHCSIWFLTFLFSSTEQGHLMKYNVVLNWPMKSPTTLCCIVPVLCEWCVVYSSVCRIMRCLSINFNICKPTRSKVTTVLQVCVLPLLSSTCTNHNSATQGCSRGATYRVSSFCTIFVFFIL